MVDDGTGRQRQARFRWQDMFEQRTIRWRTAFTYGLAVAAVLAISASIVVDRAGRGVQATWQDAFVRQAEATAASPTLTTTWPQGGDRLDGLLTEWSTLLGAPVVAVSAEGALWANSEDTLVRGSDLLRLPEVRAALAGETGRSIRIDDATGVRMLHVGVPIAVDGATVGALRWSLSLAEQDAVVARVGSVVAAAAVLSALTIIFLLVLHIERSVRTIRRLTDMADHITAGDLDARIWSFGSGEVAQLAHAFNRMADKLQRQIKKRAREKDRLNTVLHVMADGVVILNRHGRVRMLNTAATRILHADAEASVKRSFVQVARDHRVAEVWLRCQRSGQEAIATVDLDGNRFIRVVVSPFLRGADRGYLVIFQDLSQIRLLQTVRQDFVSNVSHELRTPLASLRALVDTLRDGALDDPPAAHRFLDRMETEVDSLTQMVQELLELSRIESGKAPLRFYPEDLHQVVAASVERLRTQAERAHLGLAADVSAGLPPVLIDAERIQQVLTNLIHNAIKFTPPGGRITITARADDGQLTVAVQDTGVGIAADDLPRIFERFYKADRARAGGGTGLGLAIAKHIVHAHGGQIWAESQEGAGSTFHFTVPCSSAEGAQPDSQADLPASDVQAVAAVAARNP